MTRHQESLQKMLKPATAQEHYLIKQLKLDIQLDVQNTDFMLLIDLERQYQLLRLIRR